MRAGEAGDVAARLGLAFLALAGAGEAAPRRMRALVERAGAAAVFAEAGCETKRSVRSRRRAALRDILGAREFGAAVVVGAAAPFGEIDAVRFRALIERARALGASSLRLTPWRAFLIVGLDPRGAESLVHSMSELGFIVDADDPRLRIAACPGAPACMHGHRRVRDDATRWAALLPKGDGVILHVSGCAKGCARPSATAATLTATATGYDLILAVRPAIRRRGAACRARRSRSSSPTRARGCSRPRGCREAETRLRKGRRGDLSPVLRHHSRRGRAGAFLADRRTGRGAGHPCLRHGGGGPRPRLLARRRGGGARGASRRRADLLRCAHGRRRGHAGAPACEQ